MSFDDEQFIYRIGKMSLGPNDVVVIKTDMMLDKQQIQYLRDRVDENLKTAGITNKVLVFTHGLELQIIEKEDA